MFNARSDAKGRRKASVHGGSTYLSLPFPLSFYRIVPLSCRLLDEPHHHITTTTLHLPLFLNYCSPTVVFVPLPPPPPPPPPQKSSKPKKLLVISIASSLLIHIQRHQDILPARLFPVNQQYSLPSFDFRIVIVLIISLPHQTSSITHVTIPTSSSNHSCTSKRVSFIDRLPSKTRPLKDRYHINHHQKEPLQQHQEPINHLLALH